MCCPVPNLLKVGRRRGGRGGRRWGGERKLSRPTGGTKPDIPGVVFRWLVPACFGTILAACDSPDPGIDPELDTRAELETTEPGLLGAAQVPYSMSTSVALLDEHTACTVDSYETEIECFERSGRLIGRFGATGEGPGEFGFPKSAGTGQRKLSWCDRQHPRALFRVHENRRVDCGSLRCPQRRASSSRRPGLIRR